MSQRTCASAPIVAVLAMIALPLLGCSDSSNSNMPSVRLNETPLPPADSACPDSLGYGFVCGPQNAEDLVAVPDTSWIVASGMAPGAPIYLVDAAQKTWAALYPSESAGTRHDTATYGACPGAPDLTDFQTHGLSLRPGEGGHSVLYAVSHGAREAIEVFDLDASGNVPTLTWIGCVEMPAGLAANSVASFTDGSIVATVLAFPDKTFAQLMAGEPTGAVYGWSPGDAGFTLIEGTELPGNNGIEVSTDQTKLYVVSSGLRTVVAFERANPTREIATTKQLPIIPDNVHMGPDGRLITAGTIIAEPACGGLPAPDEFDIEAYAQCPRGFIAIAIDPATMQTTEIARGRANADFSNATMALPLGDEVWVGTFASDRIGYVTLPDAP